MIFQSDKTALKVDEWFKKTSISLLLVLVFSVGLNVGQECGQLLAPFSDFLTSIDYFDRCSFPTLKLNANCLLDCCPKLSGLSPVNSAGIVDSTVVHAIMTVLNDCLATTPTICGITVASTPMVQTAWTFNSIFPASMAINGTCVLNQNSGNINNLNRAVFSLAPQQGPNGQVTVTLSAPYITQLTSWNCSMSVPNTFFNPLQTGSIDLLNFPNVMATLNMTVNPTININLAANPPTFSVVNEQSNISVSLYNFKSCALNLPQVLVDVINQAINKYFKASTTTTYAVNFHSTFATQGINAAIQSCR